MKNQTLLLTLLCCNILDTLASSQADINRTPDERVDEVHVGVILDMGSWQGKVMESCISKAISDSYITDKAYKAKVVLHVKDSQGDPFRALSAALNLLEDAKVGAIVGAQTSLEAKFLAEFAERNKIPVISFSTPSSFHIKTRSPYFVQIAHDQTSQVKGVTALIQLYKWRNAILIHEKNDDLNLDLDDTISYMAAFFEEKNIRIAFMSAIDTASEDDQIIEQLHELKGLQTTVFVVHMPHFLTSRLFVNAKRLGMISEGYAWIVTSKAMNHLHLRDSSIVESMLGVLGFRSYIPASEELHTITSGLRTKFYTKEPDVIQDMQLNILGLLVYDVASSLRNAAERVVVKVTCDSKLDNRSNSMDLDIFRTSMYGSILLQEILRRNSKGLGGVKLVPNAFEIVNVVSNGERRIGFCTSTGRIKREIDESNHRRELSFTNTLESVIWPGGSSTIPHGRVLQTSGKILKIGVPVNMYGYRQLVEVRRDPRTNDTTVSGFCVEVFKAALEGLKYHVQYQFIPLMGANGSIINYSDIIYQVYLQKFDAVVGDTTITANRSLYVDFTTPYTDIGVGIVAANIENRDMWIFLKPLTVELWLTVVGFHIITGFLIWLIEFQSTRHSTEGLAPQRNEFPFSILVGRWEQLTNNWSTFLSVVSLFVMFILSSSYTATLASMMTVQSIELNSKGSYIGYPWGSLARTSISFSNLNFEDNALKPLNSAKEFANILSKGSKNGGVSAILDEIPYIKIFLAEYPADFSLIKTLPTSNGFGFVFPKGSRLVNDISNEIVRLRESGRLNMLENEWFRSQVSLKSRDDAGEVRPLTPTNFGGLFLISGILSVVAFLMFQFLLLKKNSHAVRNCTMNLVNVSRKVHHCGKKYFSKIIFIRIRTVNSAAIQSQVQMISPQQGTPS